MTPHDRSIRMCRAVARLSRAGPWAAARATRTVGGLRLCDVRGLARRRRRAVGTAPACRPAAGLVRPFRGIRYCGYTPTLYSLACDGPEFIYRVKDSSAVSHSAIGDRHARVFTRWKRLVNRALVSYLDRLCSPLLPAARPGPAARSPAPCRRALYHLPQPMLMSISICAMRRRGLVALPVLLVVALPLPPAAHVRQGSMRGMQGRHGGGRRRGREAARRRGLARVHTGGRERPKSDEHTLGSLGRESAPGTRACVRSLSSTSPCDGDTAVSARVQTAVSTPCGGSTQGQKRGHKPPGRQTRSVCPWPVLHPGLPGTRPSAPPIPCRGSGGCPAGSSARVMAAL